MSAHPELDRLVDLVARFRGERGCAWYEAQTHASLVKYLIEETHELVEAIESGDAGDIREELGDVLFQVLFHASIGELRGDGRAFGLEDVARDQADKLERRNPHVFGERPTRDMDEIIRLWSDAKAVEKRDRESIVDGVPAGLPALARADKLLGKARQVGLERAGGRAADEAGDSGAARAVEEATHDDAELTTAEAALGERLLGIVREARAAGLDAERALRIAIRQLEARVRAHEAAARG
ncbi:nucleoside triphosphate pyrophosphohydrolase [Pseudoclavibacter endophyticus]|nr:MazG family protein [Pseudoclavibacter endophyticus]GGA61229.1 nucleoside triphosphate pyrophosphohydrolase [Pseudoclavibacter endophyticus]